MHDRERNAAHKGLARQPDHDIAVLAQRPEKRKRAKLAIGFTQNENALRLELIEIVHGAGGRQTHVMLRYRAGR